MLLLSLVGGGGHRRRAGLQDLERRRVKALTALDIWVDSSSRRRVSSFTCIVS